VKSKRIILGIVLGFIVVGGLYLLNRYWIAPATTLSAKGDSLRPMAPDFTLTSLSGQSIDLKNYRGKVVLLDFWATWCGPCRIEIPGFEDLERKYGPDGLQIIGVSMDDSPDPVRQFYQQLNMNYPVVMGSDKVGEMYGGIFGLPTSFLIGRDGRIYAKHVGATDEGVFAREIQELLAAAPNQTVTNFETAGGGPGSDDISVETPAEVNSPVPGVDVSKLTPAQLTELKKDLTARQCSCGCGYTVLQCRQVDGSCATSLKMAKDVLAKLRQNNTI
jgi:cytochrome c biogenesis protein CcmG/thiol:disulfide interchange protein DsbE